MFSCLKRHSPLWTFHTIKSELVGYILLMPYEIIRWLKFSLDQSRIHLPYPHRHSSHWSFLSIKLETMKHRISLMSYEIIRYPTLSIHVYHIHLLLSTQALTTLNLSSNQIGDKGAQDLADALRNNTVTHIFYTCMLYPSPPIHADTPHAEPFIQSNQR